jgi:hypothetical protein
MVRARLSIVARGSRKGLGLFQGLYAANLLRPEVPAGNNHPHSKTWMAWQSRAMMLMTVLSMSALLVRSAGAGRYRSAAKSSMINRLAKNTKYPMIGM